MLARLQGIRSIDVMDRRAALLGGMGCFLGSVSSAYARPRHENSAEIVFNPYAEMMVDITNHRVLHSLDVGVPVRPASLCKLMTINLLFTAMEKGTLSEVTPILFSDRAVACPPTRLGLARGESIPAGEAACAMAVHSCNDVATAVAEALSGTEDAFAVLMTNQAHTMGLQSTFFSNASGLPHPGNRSTARDLLLLGAQTVLGHPRYAHILGISAWSWEGHSYENTNRLQAGYSGMLAGKTGYIRSSGFNLFAMAQRDGRTLAAIVVGGRTGAARNERMKELLDIGFAS